MDAMARFQRDCTAFFQTLYPGGQSPLVFGAGLAKKPVLMRRPASRKPCRENPS